MNVRKWILWGFAVALMTEVTIGVGAIANYVCHHPEAVFGAVHDHHN